MEQSQTNKKKENNLPDSLNVCSLGSLSSKLSLIESDIVKSTLPVPAIWQNIFEAHFGLGRLDKANQMTEGGMPNPTVGGRF